jgi:hypothetical protein
VLYTGQFFTSGPAFLSLQSTTTPIVPEPSTLLLLASGLIGMALWLWMRRSRIS